MVATISRASEADYQLIIDIGREAVEEAHRDSAPPEDLRSYLTTNYNENAIRGELRDSRNIYHLVYEDEQPVGFSKIVLNEAHPDISESNVTKLDRIYLLKEYYGRKLGAMLMDFNIQYSQQHDQAGMWLHTWIGNERAIEFYKKAGFIIIGKHDFKVSENHSNPNHHMLLRY